MSDDKETFRASPTRMSTTMSGLTSTTTSTTTTTTTTTPINKVSSSFMTNSTIATTTAAYTQDDVEEDEYFQTQEDEDDEEEECLPFALPEEQYETVLTEESGSVLISSPLYNSGNNSSSESGNYTSAAAATSSSNIHTSSILQSSPSDIPLDLPLSPSSIVIEQQGEHDSILLSTAAAISAAADEVLQHACGSLTSSSSTPEDSTIKNVNLLDFSQLMREADDTIQDNETTNNTTQETITISDENCILDNNETTKEKEEGITIVPASHSSDTPMVTNAQTTTTTTTSEGENVHQEDGLWGYLFGGKKDDEASNNNDTDIAAGPMQQQKQQQQQQQQQATLSLTAPVPQTMRNNNNRSSSIFYNQSTPQYHYSKNQIKAVQTSPSSFRLSTTIPLRPQLSSSLDNKNGCSTVREVIDIIANPDLLKLWCDSISCVLLIESIGNDNGHHHHTKEATTKREYDGEWIKITTSTLTQPPRSSTTSTVVTNPTSCLTHGCIVAKTYLGFPTHGDVTMFVERSRGQVGVTIGPFPEDGILVSHTIMVNSLMNNNTGGEKNEGSGNNDVNGVEIVDQVRLSREGEEYGNDDDQNINSSICSGCLSQSCCGPNRIVGHMNQAISSLEKLRVLVELGGETSAFGCAYNTTTNTATTSGVAAAVAPLFMGGNGGNSCGSSLLLGMEHDGGRTPLLG